MALILVAEQEARYIERIHDALTSEGWRVKVVRREEEAFAAASAEPPQLVVVNVELAGAGKLLHTFSKKTGGPGVVALIPEQGVDTDAVEQIADDLVDKPFTDQELRLAIRRGLAPGPSPPVTPPAPSAIPADGDRQLTSQDIFGDLLAEVEGEIDEDRAPVPAPPPSPTPATPEPTKTPSPGRRSAELDRALEETLSGLRQGTAERRPKGAAKRPRRSDDVDVEALLSETLDGIGLPRSRGKARAPSTARPSAGAGAADSAGAPIRRSAGGTDPGGPEALVRPPADRPARSPAAVSEGAGGPSEAPPPPRRVEPPQPTPSPPAPPPSRAEGRPPEAPADAPAEAPMEASGWEAHGLGVGSGEPTAPPEDLAAWPPVDSGSWPETGPPPAPRPVPPPASTPERRRFGQYTLLERIAIGGMAEVWKARMTGVEGFQKTVAIKKILPHLTGSEDFVNMLVDEAKLAAQLNHPNIVHIYDLGKIDDQLYIAMEYVEGQNLRTLMNEARHKKFPIPVGISLLVAARLANALHYAHRKKDFEGHELGLVHRDVSPQNVLLSHEGDIKLCDFGIVKAVAKASQTQMGALKGKLQYMSPEQAWGKPVDARSDIFSLGVILFEMLAGQRLFAGDSELSVLEAVRRCQIRAPRELNREIPEPVETVVLKALEQDPENRYQTAGQMQKEVETLLYSMRPAPSQADLVDYLNRLDGAEPMELPPSTPPAEPAPPGAVGETDAPEPRAAGEEILGPVAASAAEQLPPIPDEIDEGMERDAAVGKPSKLQVAALAAVTEGEVEVEEGGSRGKKVLWSIIVLLALLGAATGAYLWVQRPWEPSAPPPAPETSPPAPEESAPDEPGAATADHQAEPLSSASDRELDPLGTAPRETPPGDADRANPPPEEPGSPPAPSAAKDPSPIGGETAEDAAATPRSAAAQTVPRPREARGEGARRDPPSAPEPTPARRAPQRRDSKETGAVAAAAPTASGLPARELEHPAESPPAAVDPQAYPAQTTSKVEPPREPGAPLSGPASPSGQSPADAAASAPPKPTEVTPTKPAEAPGEKAPANRAPEVAKEPEVREGDLVGPGPGVKPPELVSIEKPKYPPIAKRMRVEGEIVLSILVDETGRVTEARVTRGEGRKVGLDEAALEAARTAKYQPATKNGVRVKMWTVLRVPFRL